MGTVVHLTEDAGEIVSSLGGNVVEVDSMTHSVHDGEEQGSESDDLVSLDVAVEWNIVVEDGFSQVGDEVASHSEQEDGVSPHHARGSTTGDGNTIPCNSPQSSMFSLHRVVVGSLNKDCSSDEHEESQVEDLQLLVLYVADKDGVLPTESRLRRFLRNCRNFDGGCSKGRFRGLGL